MTTVLQTVRRYQSSRSSCDAQLGGSIQCPIQAFGVRRRQFAIEVFPAESLTGRAKENLKQLGHELGAEHDTRRWGHCDVTILWETHKIGNNGNWQ